MMRYPANRHPLAGKEKERDAEKLHPSPPISIQFTVSCYPWWTNIHLCQNKYSIHCYSIFNSLTVKSSLFDFDTTRSRNLLLLNTLRQRNVKHTVHHLSLNGVKVNVFRKSKALMV